MIERMVEIKDLDEAKKELGAIGCDIKGIELMAPKAVSRVVKIKGVKPAAANIIKQEMLSLGGEAAVAHGVVNHSVESTDVLVIGTLKQLGQLTNKLKQHQFGLPQIAQETDLMLRNCASSPKPIKIGKKTLAFGDRTYIMGVLNVTPDSFSDGGEFSNLAAAVEHGKQMLADGADIIDIGGESTRPGALPVSVEEEKKRVLPVIEKLAKESTALISIDTTKAEVAKAALSAGALMVNDISGFRFDPKMPKVLAGFKVPVCLMHIKGKPGDMQQNPRYTDLMHEVINYLSEGLEIAKKAGILHEQIIIDPGIGFGKTVEHNLEILKRLKELKVLGCPVLVGPSRKSLIGRVLNLPVKERLAGTAAAVAVAVMNGADIVRVHDVMEMARVVKMTKAIWRGRENG